MTICDFSFLLLVCRIYYYTNHFTGRLHQPNRLVSRTEIFFPNQARMGEFVWSRTRHCLFMRKSWASPYFKKIDFTFSPVTKPGLIVMNNKRLSILSFDSELTEPSFKNFDRKKIMVHIFLKLGSKDNTIFQKKKIFCFVKNTHFHLKIIAIDYKVFSSHMDK